MSLPQARHLSFSKAVASMLFGDMSVNEDEAIHAGGGHEGQNFCTSESIEAVDAKVDYPAIVLEP